MRNLGVKEAADAIRGAFLADRSSRVDPEQAHQMKFAKEVNKELGGADTPEDVQHVVTLLREHGIELHAGHEYPKFATRKHDRTAKIVHSEEEANDWINEAPPEPVNPDDAPPLRTLDAPVQDLSLDLRHSVPGHPEMATERVPRVPPAVTNREAAQDAYARQGTDDHNRDEAAAAYDRAAPELGRAHTDHVDGTDDGEVHMEEGEDVLGLDELAPTGSKAEGGAPYAKPAGVGVVAHDDPDGDGLAGQDVNPTHDSVLGAQSPQDQSPKNSAGRIDNPERRPVGNRNNKRPE